MSNCKGWIKARDVQNSIRCFKKVSSNRICSIFRELEANSYGVTKLEGKKLIWNADNSLDSVDAE
ncbi:hypothetical protein [Pleurocapsa sp. FMAR1]|uniref:hypothetical protein n=1 Tax=Pleurocapsa sp. FMAR1 TaxID=3040204 RepID=UPI0029C6EE37|nr:hypothetical protein [Pleurocapsa sp. FMAR1]